MDEEILKNLENISENLEYLIQYLQDKEESKQNDEVDNTMLDTISNDFNTFNIYLKSIDKNVQLSNQKMSAYLDSIATLENTPIDNPELDQFNQSITNLISKLDDLKNNLGTVNGNLNLNIDPTQIDAIKDKLNSDLMLNLNVNDIDTTIDDINSKLNALSNTPINLNLDNSINNLNILINELDNLKNLNLDNLNLDIVNSDNIQKLIDELSQIEKYSDLNLNSLKDSLLEIQKINLDNLNIDKLNDIKLNIDSTEVSNQINNISEEFKKIQSFKIDLELNFDLTSKIDEIKTELSNTANEIKTSMLIEPEINYKVNSENLQSIKNDFQNIDITLTPDDELINTIKNSLDNQVFNVKINPIIDNAPIIETKNETDFRIIKESTESLNESKMVSFMEENNKLLNNLIEAINNNKPAPQEVINLVPETITKQESIVNVNPNSNSPQSSNSNNDMTVVISLLKDLVESNKNIGKKLTKNGFNTDTSF